jgi:hypothetical protein
MSDPNASMLHVLEARPSTAAGVFFCLSVAAFVRFGVLWGVDLRGSFGPDAPVAAAAAVRGALAYPYPLHPLAIAALTPLASGDPENAALVLSLLSGFATVVAAWLMGRLLAGEHAGRAAGALTACSPLFVETSLLRGGDALALAMAAWGTALAWYGAFQMGPSGDLLSLLGDRNGRRRRIRWGSIILAGGLLWGLSAWAKPVALPAGLLLLAALSLGTTRVRPWLAAGVAGGLAIASKQLHPLIFPGQATAGPGSWWQEVPRSAGDWLMLPRNAMSTLVGLDHTASWAMGFPLLLLGTLGGFSLGGARKARRLVWLCGAVALLGTAAVVGDHARPRAFGPALLAWTILAGVAVLPWRLRLARMGGVTGTARFLESLPLSLVMTLFVVSMARFWEGLGRVRAEEEGAATPRGFFEGWTESFRPDAEFADASICGGLELERLATEVEPRLPQGAIVATVPLRNGRGAELRSRLEVSRPDLHFLELDSRCCPRSGESCATGLNAALAATGGIVVAPLPEAADRCRTGAVPAGYEDLVTALDPLLTRRLHWYGYLEVPRDPTASEGPVCLALGGDEPADADPTE